MSASSALNLSRTYQLEESLAMAKSRSDRYEHELVTEMERCSALASKAARLEEANSALKEQLSTVQAEAAAQARQVLDLKSKAAERASHASAQDGISIAPPGAGDSDEQLHEARAALLRSQRDLELANAAAEDSKAECSRLSERLRAAEQRAVEAVAGSAAISKEESVQELSEQVTSLEVLRKHLTRDLEKAKADLHDLPDLRKKAAAFADALAREDELKRRLERVNEKLSQSLEVGGRASAPVCVCLVCRLHGDCCASMRWTAWARGRRVRGEWWPLCCVSLTHQAGRWSPPSWALCSRSLTLRGVATVLCRRKQSCVVSETRCRSGRWALRWGCRTWVDPRTWSGATGGSRRECSSLKRR